MENQNQLIKRLTSGYATESYLDATLAAVKESIKANGASSTALASASMARGFLSLESFDDVAQGNLETSVAALESAVGQFNASLPEKSKRAFDRRSIDAGLIAGVLAGSIGSAQTLTRTVNQTSLESHQTLVPPQGQGDYFESRMKASLEAYDEKENRDATVYSIAYNMHAARQDEFAEAFYPTVVVTPNQVGYTVSIRVITVYNEVRRNISGALNDFGKRNIIHAVIDPTILKNDQTRIVPVFRDESKDKFVDEAVLPAEAYDLEGESIPTSDLAIGKPFSLLGISQTEALLETGILDSTDSIDPAVDLQHLTIKVGSEVIRLKTFGLPGANFTYATQGNYRMVRLAFDSVALGMKGVIKQVDGSDSVVLKPIADNKVQVQLRVDVTGKVNLELGDTVVNAAGFGVAAVYDEEGKKLPLDAGMGKQIADLFADAEVIGYALSAFRTNMNRRQRGQLLDTTFYSQIYNVPLRSPITVPRPLTTGDQTDASDLAALITATHIRTSNAAVDELIRVGDLLKEHVVGSNTIEAAPAIFGVASWLVTPVYEHFDLNVSTVINSLKSHERAKDIQAVLVNKLRDMVYRLYRDSGYKAAADAMAGGIAETPTVIIGTDPVLARYLMVDGDFRTIGPDFNVKVVSTLNIRMKDRIFVTFGEFGAGKEGQPNPLHFGNMAWKPELTLVLPLHRNGANSKELTVQPSFLHITNLPVLGSLLVTGIEPTVEDTVKVPVDIKSQPTP